MDVSSNRPFYSFVGSFDNRDVGLKNHTKSAQNKIPQGVAHTTDTINHK